MTHQRNRSFASKTGFYPYQNTAVAYNYSNNPRIQAQHFQTKSNARLLQEKRRRKILFSFYCKIAVALGVISVSSLMFLSNYIIIGAKQTELVALTEQLRELQSDISFTEAKIAQALNISTIEKTAKEKLSMSKPLPHQIDYIEVK